MEQEKFKAWMMEYLSGELDAEGERKFINFLQEHPKYKQEFDNLNKAWSQMNLWQVPDPSDTMDEVFFEMLATEKNSVNNQRANFMDTFLAFLNSLFKPAYWYGFILLGVGLTAGYFLKTNTTDTIKTTTISNSKPSETEKVREKLVLTLLEQPSVTKRLQGVNEANKMNKIEESIIKALLKTLNNDTNVNVRLAAIESLTNYLNHPMVREGLVQSIVLQDSPIVQISLANLMVALQEKKSIAPFKTLLRTKKLDTTVKQRLQTSINSII